MRLPGPYYKPNDAATWESHPVLSPERGFALSSSGAGFLELETSAGTHLPPTFTHAFELYVHTTFPQVATLGRKRLLPGAEGLRRSRLRNRRHRRYRCK